MDSQSESGSKRELSRRLRTKSFRELMEPDQGKHDSLDEQIKARNEFIFKKRGYKVVPLTI